jgi:hypothetical protein
MTRVEIPRARASIMETPTSLLVAIPATRNWFIVLFIGFWMCGWLFGEGAVIHTLASGKTPLTSNLFLFGWLGAWTVGGTFAGYQWLWNVVGKELIVLGQQTLAIKSDVLGFGRVREFDLAEVRDLRVDRPSGLATFNWGWTGQGNGTGTIAFDYGAKTFRFGFGLDESEARQLIARLNARHRFQAASAQ